MTRNKQLKGLTGLAAFSVMLFGLGMLGHTAYAVIIGGDAGGTGLSSEAPVPGSGRNYSGNTSNYFGAGSSITPYYVIGNSANNYTYSGMQDFVYVQRGTGSITITIDNAYGNCYSASGGGVVGPDYTQNGGVPTTQYTLLGPSGTLGQKTVQSGGCGSVSFAPKPSSAAYSMTATNNYDGYFIVESKILNSPGQGENSFRLEVTSGTAIIGNGALTFGIGYRDGNLNNGNYFSEWSTYALPETCSELNNPISKSASIDFHDMDPSRTDWNTAMVLLLQKQLINPDGTTGSWTNMQSKLQSQGQIAQNGSFSFTAFTNYRYRLVMANIGVRNTIRIHVGSPLTTLYSKISERPTIATCFPAVSCTTNPNAVSIPPGGSATIAITGTISSGQWPSSYYLRRSPPPYAPGSYKNITAPGVSSGNDTESPPSTTTFNYFVASSNPNYTVNHLAGGPALNSTPCKATVTISDFVVSCTNIVIHEPAGTYYIKWFDGGNLVYTSNSFTVPTNGVSLQTKSYFAASAWWPHKGYSADLYTSAGSYVAVASLPVCLHFTSCTANIDPNPPEVGQTVHYLFVVTYTNSTNANWPNKYSGVASATPGAYLNAPTTVIEQVLGGSSSWSFINPSTGQSYFTGHVDYTGTYNLKIIPLDGSNQNLLPGPCNGGVPTTTPQVKPYFQVWNGDSSSGGGFASPTGSPFTNIPYSCGTSSDPAYVTTGSNNGYSYPYSGSKYSGSTIGFGKLNFNRGSRVDFGAVAMGQIPGTTSGLPGFFSGDAAIKRPVFANTPAVYGAAGMGGYLSGYAPNQCVKDYYSDSFDQIGAQPSQGLQTDISNCPADICQTKAGSSVTIGGAPGCSITVPQATQLSLYVNGDVTIYCNIVYQKNFDPTNQANIPYLAIIAKGNIKVENSVSELDGLYVAQPTGVGASTANGVFYTCDPSTKCNNQLVVNGAVIAQQLQLLRVHGTLDIPSPDANGVTGNPAEIFNFVPSMVIGAPALPSQFGQLQGSYSLAPTF